MTSSTVSRGMLPTRRSSLPIVHFSRRSSAGNLRDERNAERRIEREHDLVTERRGRNRRNPQIDRSLSLQCRDVEALTEKLHVPDPSGTAIEPTIGVAR